MNDQPSTSKQNVSAYEDEIFEDSTILANFNNSSFKDVSSRASENNANDSINRSGLNISALCCDEEISGYDKLTGQTWVYPTNYPVRDYQYNIIKASLLKNTLVSLPTGLGKTFIAAVVMYNFYRWYPLGKIVFTAPTRPLVGQQIDACYNIVAIPQGDTVEMTGHTPATTRKTLWKSKRVFFATPQVIYNDIKSGICPAHLIRCLVFDEAHRARGNYAYGQIVGTLTDMGHRTYRVLALSATPGSKVEDVIQVVRNLHIAHLELRTEGCIDVVPYSHARQIHTVLIPLGTELTQLRQQYIEIVDGYARRLKQMSILPQNLGNLSKGRVVMLYKEFQNKERGARHPQHNYIMKDFTLLIALFHGLELLVKHGSRVFLNFFDEHPEKSWMQRDDQLTALLERLRDDLGADPLGFNTSVLPDGTVPEIPKNLCFGHPKFSKLKEIMVEHFTKAKRENQDTRAIVFCEYRESVSLVHRLLLQCRPLILPQMFVGQGAAGKDGKTAVSQKAQLRVLRAFRAGACNVLACTCVGEEGLDVGSVDLIVCFDVSTRSPVRLVQRCGRTGRGRSGKVHILVTEGREHQTLLDCMRQRDGLNKKIQQSKEVEASLYPHNPRMMPRGFTPVCRKMHLTVDTQQRTEDKDKKGQKDLRSMLLKRGSSGQQSTSGPHTWITEQEFTELFPLGYTHTDLFREPAEYWAKSREAIMSSIVDPPRGLELSTWLEWQRAPQPTASIHHSADSDILSSLLQYGDAKRFQLPPSTQQPTFETQDFASQKIIPTSPKKVASPAKPLTPSKSKAKKKQKPSAKSPGKKDGDIRALFSTATKSTKNYTKLINDLGIKDDGSIPTSLINLLVDLSLSNTNEDARKCYICDVIIDCTVLRKTPSENNIPPSLKVLLNGPVLPDIDLLDDLDAETILKCTKKDVSVLESHDVAGDVSYINDKEQSKNFDLEFDFDSPIDLTSPGNNKEDNDDADADNNFDIGDIEDIFADSSPEEAIAKTVDNDKKSTEPIEALGFFGLDSIDDIFADSDDSLNNNVTKTPSKPKNTASNTNKNEATPSTSKIANINKNTEAVKLQTSPQCPTSPSILSGKVKPVPSSPILCSQVRRFNLSTKKKLQSSTPVSAAKRCLIPEASTSKNEHSIRNEKSKSTITQNSQMNTTDKSMFTITQLVEMINKTGEKSVLSNSHSTHEKQMDSKDDRSSSPILLTQADRKKANASASSKNTTNTSATQKKPESLIILESDSDSDIEANNTQAYDLDNDIFEIKDSQKMKTPEKKKEVIKLSPVQSPISVGKRKLSFLNDDDLIAESPYFNKKQKTESPKRLSLQQKVLAALTSNKIDKINFNNDNKDRNINFVTNITSPLFSSQKENTNPQFDSFLEQKKESPEKSKDIEKEEYIRKNNLQMLQMFRRDSKLDSPKLKFESMLNGRSQSQLDKRKVMFDDSDDDFVDGNTEKKPVVGGRRINGSITNHKVRKKKRKPRNPFVELEAELSDDMSDSGDELSDDSVGSIAEFICDDTVTHPPDADMRAVYMRSVRSPVKGVFKIPQLPNKYAEDVFSQVVEEDDAYEMDSFCVDSHIGLTQVGDMSELEVAELVLEQRTRTRKRPCPSPAREGRDDSPLVRKRRNVKRIQSDSEDSS